MNLFGLSISRQKAVVPVMSVSNMPGLLPLNNGRSSWFGALFETFTGQWQRNIIIDDQRSLLAFSAIYACISRIANDISILRPMLMSIDSNIWTEETQSPLAVVLRKQNSYQTYIQFLLMWMVAKLMYGNAYILKERDQRGIVTALYPLHSGRVQVMVAPDGGVFYQISADQLSGVGDQILVPANEVIHDRMNTLWHPLVGVSPIYAAGASATQGNRIQNNSEKFFANMSRPSGQLTAPGHIDDETAARLKREFEQKFSGDNIGRLWVSGDGLKFETIPIIPAEQSQLVEQLKWTVEDVARPFHMPLFKIGAGQQPTHNNVGALQQQYLSETLQIHIEAIEQLLREGLNLPTRYGVQLETEAFLRMDPKTRAETDAIDMGAGILKPNEGRAKRDLMPVPGGDTPYMQQQNYSLAALAKRDSKEDPFETTPKPAAPAANDDEAAAEREAAALIEAVRKGLEYAA
jgi:HK97 family phage portal protein